MARLAEVLGSTTFKQPDAPCRIVIAGRPYSLDMHWERLIAGPRAPMQPDAWAFALLEEFDELQQERRLGSERYKLVPREARPILGVPRVLEYLCDVSQQKFSEIHTPSDVFWFSTQEMLKQAKDRTAPANSTKLTIYQAVALLSAMAFEMLTGQEEPNRSLVEGKGDIERFLKRVTYLLQSAREVHGYDYEKVTTQLTQLAAWNTFIGCGFLEPKCPRQIQFRDTSLLEFFAGAWCALYATVEHAQRLRTRLFLREEQNSYAWRWVWRYASEFPLKDAAADAWTTSIAVLFQPGDGTVAGTKRSTEMHYRAHANWLRSGTGELRRLFEEDCLGPYQAEFQNILAGKREEEPQRIAKEFLAEFRRIVPNDKRISATFLMGSPDTEPDRGDDEHQHRVTLTRPFELACYAVTNAQYALFDPGHSKRFSCYDVCYYDVYSPEPDCPALYITWYDAYAYSLWLGNKYRLPTEAEWEYACRAGTTTPFHFGDVLNVQDANRMDQYPYGTKTKGPFRTTPVGSYAANRFELYDMHGNVWEWCQDWYDPEYYTHSPAEDPEGPSSGTFRVMRGGSWRSDSRVCRAANRGGIPPDCPDGYIGIRVART